MDLRLSWTATTASDVCIRIEGGDSMLHCWQQQRGGELEVALQRQDSAVFHLLDTRSLTVLDQAEVTVVSRDLRDSRRRRRHVWSII